MAERGTIDLNEEFERFKEKIKQRARVVDPDKLFNPRECYEDGMLDMFNLMRPVLEAVWKTSDHRLIGHSEPDDYTKLGCVTHLATEGIEHFWRELLYQYNADLNKRRFEESNARKPDEKEPWGPSNPAWSAAQADHRLREWATTGMSVEVDPNEVLGWTKDEYKDYVQERTVPDGYEP